ncbi:G-protein coupled receptor 98 [Microtus ochrogaster]|uniref:Adhesion G-protein coupled receptor V1 n=1 Tax=Microtus ochrogaster TaxID=79684 RepID=A0A8J6G407_MICOH|nr:G-protein coupled receptor 98 [Microtus ochrogaster]
MSSVNGFVFCYDARMSSVNGFVFCYDARVSSVNGFVFCYDALMSSVNGFVFCYDARVSSVNGFVFCYDARVSSVNGFVFCYDALMSSVNGFVCCYDAVMSSVNGFVFCYDAHMSSVNGFVFCYYAHMSRMISSFLLVSLPALLISFVSGEAEIRFSGQTEFFVNETSTTVIRLVIERLGEPANVTAIVSLNGEDTGDFFDTYAAAFIPSGGTNRTVYIAVCDDDLPEPDEAFTFLLTLQPSSISVIEPRSRNESVPLTLIREKGTYGVVTVTFDVSGGPNPPEEDLTPIRGNITFPPGRASVIHNWTVLDDEVPENDEVFVIQLKTVEGGAEINASRSSVEIVVKKNDSPVKFVQSVYLIPEDDHILTIPVVRGKDVDGNMIGSDESEVSVSYKVMAGDSTAHAQPNVDFIDLQANTTLTFPPFVHESHLKFQIIDDSIPEIAESFHVVLLKNTLQGDAVLMGPSSVQVTIKPNDKPYGVLSFNSILFERPIIIDEDKASSSRFEEITVVRNGGTHGDVSVDWLLTRNSTDPSPVTADISPSSGTLRFAQGQMLASILLTVVDDDLPEEAEVFLLTILPPTAQGGAEVSEPAQLLLYIQDSDDVYGEIAFFPVEGQKMESSPTERCLSLSLARLGGAKGDVKVTYSALYIPAGAVDPLRAKDGVLNTSRSGSLLFPEHSNQVTAKLPIRNDAFLQNEAHFLVQVYIPLHRDGTDGQATVYWSLKPSGFNSQAVTMDDTGPFNGSVVFLSGQSDTTIGITVKGDDIPELNETVTLSLDRVSVDSEVLKSGYTSRDLIILENDDPGGIFEFSQNSRGPYVIREGDAVELRITRSRGCLVRQFLRYHIEPRESNEFYGNTGVLEFTPGEREVVITLLSRLDGMPELDEHYWVILSSHGERESRLGSATVVNITILKNDEPHGIIDFVSDDLTVSIKESKGEDIYSAVYGVIRTRGNFGEVSVSWMVSPDFTQDVFPVQGTVYFGDQEFSKTLTVYSLVDEPYVLRIQEGDTANFTVLRNGSVNVTCTVQYATMDGEASGREGDFVPVELGETLVFEAGSREQSVSVYVNDDEIPETDEPFYVILFNSTGDTVVYQYGIATVIIEANDDPNGVFSLEPIDKAVEEGKMNAFWILRHRGHFGNVSVMWQLFQNVSLQSGQEFYETSGTVNFIDGEGSKPIVLHAFPDRIPEFNEFYILKLINISGSGGQLAETNLQVTVMIPFNDDPFGIFVLDPECLEREVAEDVLSEDDMSYITNFTILRQQGIFGDVRVGWEILSGEFPAGLPPMLDFLLVGNFPSTVRLQPHMRRHHSGTDVLYFSGLEGAFGTVDPKYHPSRNNTIANFTFSAWLMPNANTNGFVIAKDDGNGSIYYGVKIQTNESHVTLSLHYKTFGSNVTYIAKTTVMKYLEEGVWLHVLIILDDGIIEFYLDGNAVPRGIRSLKGEAISDGPGILRIGAGMNGSDRFTGWMQDVRTYERKLTTEEIYELHAMPARNDLHPVSGYLEFRQGEIAKSFIVSARDDSDEEGEEFFLLKLVSVYGGAQISEANATARLRIQKSDNANGLFGFTGACIPEITEEGSTVSCVIERTRGALDYVHVFYTISQIDSEGINYLVDDFANASGTVTFLPWQRSEVLNLYVLDEDIPELNEYFRVTLVSAVPGDGKLGSTPLSGASIDPEKETTDITIKASDHPYGLLQFSTGPPPQPEDAMSLPASSVPHLIVQEEDGEICLLVVRAQGLLGRVTVEFRTVSLTAFSPEDYQSVAGTIDFQSGERYKYIFINITDNSIPELEKSFKVELLNLDGGVSELFRIDGSGSGEGDMDFFFSPIHMHASLGVASQILVTIAASDHAHGVFEFSPESLFVSGTEPEDGYSTVVLNVTRTQGALSHVTLHWSVDSDLHGDLAVTSGNITFEIGQRTASITVEILPDEEPELDKALTMLIRSVSSGSLGVLTNATLTILASDDPYGVFIFSNKTRPISVEEATHNVTLSIIRLKGLMGEVVISYATIDDMEKPSYFPPNLARASQGADYISASGSTLFRANQIEATITVSILDDDEPEQSESVFVELVNSTLVERVQNRPREDYSIASSDVVLLEGETSKAVPIYIINDIYPELEESFLVQLLNQTTGGARLGAVTEAVITVEASDDPWGLFGFQNTKFIVEEPEFNSVRVSLPVIRNSGTLGNVTVQWVATINGQLATGDLRVVSGNVTFAPGETIQTLLLEVLADDVPEIEEVIQVQLTNASGGGTVGLDRVANIVISANDNPYGSVAFVRSVYLVQEPLERSSSANITVRRSTSDIDVVALAVEEGEDVLSYYESPTHEMPAPLWRTWVNVSSVEEAQDTCATLCLQEHACSAFSVVRTTDGPQCFWMTSWVSSTVNSSDFRTYKKNLTRVASLFSGQAVAGSDYEPAIRQGALMLEGHEFANLTISLLPDDIPEMDESFLISLLEVHLVNITDSFKNQPSIGQPNTSAVVIALNGDAFGVFMIYSVHPNTSEDGSCVDVQEQPQTSVELVIQRTGGSLGQVMVEWRVIGGTATEGLDFIGAGDILTFAEGETTKTATLMILDDPEPEDDESILILLVHTEGGSRILPCSDTVTVNILANDNVAGIVSFQTASRSVIGLEGEILQFHVIRTPPGRGNVTVEWKIVGQNLEVSFANFTGQLFFSEGTLNKTIFVHLLDDNIPEEKEVYHVVLYDVKTQGVLPAGVALLDAQGYAAVLTVEASDEPHGVLNFALSSRFVLLQEANTTIQLFINREFGSLGAINVTYATVSGILSLKNETYGNPAEPEADFVPVMGFLVLEEGETTAAINVTVLEDDIPELKEYFLVNLTHVDLIMAPLTSFPPRLDSEGLTAQIVIDANDGAQGVIEWQRSRFEVNETHGTVTLVAQRTRETLGEVSLFMYAQNLEAQMGLDYMCSPQILHFADGERNKPVEVVILDDDIPEGDERFQLILTNPSPGLELGKNTIAWITVLANDDGPGVLSFNNTGHIFLREPTSLYVQESVAVLLIIREPAQGLFGTVAVQYVVTEVNSSTESKDLIPSKGFIVLEEGVRAKALHISAILDTEPEMDEHFVCTLFNPTGGARLGTHVQTLITILQNQAPLGLFSIAAIENSATSIDVEESNRSLYLNVSRTNGLDLPVSVQWETVSETAFGMRGVDVVFSVFQSLFDQTASGWCFFTVEDSVYGVMLRKSSLAVYRWQGTFIPVEDFNIQSPKTCEAFNIGVSPYLVITHGERNGEKPSINSVYTLTSGLKLFLVQTIIISGSCQVRHFTSGSQDYFIIASQRNDSELTQVFRWNGSIFVLHQRLSVQGVLGMALFSRGGSLFLAISQANVRRNALLFTWSGSRFTNFEDVPVSGITQVEALALGDDVYLVFAKNTFLGNQNSVDIFTWEMGQSSFRYFQSLDFATVNRIHSFTPASGIVHILLIGQSQSALYCWNSERNEFSFVLDAPAAHDAAFVTVKLLNSSKTLIALVGASHSHFYELTYISSQSDFIPSLGELMFEPGDREAIIAVNILDDTVPEKEESFRVQLKNPKGGAEIGASGYVRVTVLSNDDAYGVIAFAQNSLHKQVEEMERDSLVTLNVERLKGTHGRIAIAWEAAGSISDVFPTSGVISFTEDQALSTITLTVLADDLPELSEVVIVALTRIVTEGIEDPSKGATVDENRSKSVLTILPSDSPYGVVGWHTDSLFTRVTEPTENTTVLQLRVIRDKGLFGDISIHLIAKPNFLLPINNQATENEDYVLQDSVIIMKENIKETHAEVAILPDEAAELEEGLIVTITAVNLVNPDFPAEQPRVRRPRMEIAEIMIAENDDPRGIFTFHVARGVDGVVTAHEVPPPLNILQVPVTRLAGSFETVNVHWKAAPDSAGPEDFQPSQGILQFADGQVTALIEITIIDDSEFELMETFSIGLTIVTGGGRLGDDVVVTVAIPPNDSPFGMFGFQEKTVTVDESLLSDDPDSYVTLTVFRSPGGKGAVSLHWTLEEKAKDALSPWNGTLLFDENEYQKVIALRTLQDSTLKKDRRFTIELTGTDEIEISPVKGHTVKSSMVNTVGAVQACGRGELAYPESGAFAKCLLAVSASVIMGKSSDAPALNDDIPEEKCSYEFQLTGVSVGGALNESSVTASVTMVASDDPYGRFSFSHEQLRVSEAAQRVNVTVVRSGGSFGRLLVWYETDSHTAKAGWDFVPASGELLFEARERAKSLHVEILDDDLPEGPEEFALALTKVDLQGSTALGIGARKTAVFVLHMHMFVILLRFHFVSYDSGRGYDFTIQETGLQLDQPPVIGNVSIVQIIIMENDNVEGVIEFDPKYTAISVEEDARVIMIPVLRLRGTYGHVSADFMSQGFSAVPGGYILHGSTVTFQHGQNLSFINVSIVNGSASEFEEQFEILLTGASDGAILGRHLVSKITITKSDSPFGVIRFLNQSKILIPNPISTMFLHLVLQRTGGLLGESQVSWEIMGPNSHEALPPQNGDIEDPVSGTVSFREGDGSVRTIVVTVCPHEETEAEETFIVQLTPLKNAKLDPRAKAVAITVHWELSSEFDVTGDFLSTSGFFPIADGESEASFDVLLLPDDIPEIQEEYAVQLVSVEGGAELDLEKCTTWFSVSANDDPHGVFALYSDRQSILVGQNLSRSLQINITRLAGMFGDVAVRFQILSDNEEDPVATEDEERQLVIKDGTPYKVDLVPLKNQVFLPLGSNFTVQLVSVVLLSEPLYGLPTILQEAKSAILPVPEEAANSQVGFESSAFQLLDITAGTSQVTVSRRGTYGRLSVAWTIGYAPGSDIPEPVVIGNMTPTLEHCSCVTGHRLSDVYLPNLLGPVPAAAASARASLVLFLTSVEYGLLIRRSGFATAEIEPMGVFQFSPSSRNLTVSEDAQRIRIHVQRLFGFHSDLITVSYSTTAGSAKPLEDFEPVQNGRLSFQRFQAEADFEITITDDQLPEIEETFYINLTSVENRGPRKGDANWRPRLNLDHSVAVVTILDNDDLAGVGVSVPTTAVMVALDSTLPAAEASPTTHPSTSRVTAIPHTTEMSPTGTETAGVPATPEKLVATPAALSEKPDLAPGTVPDAFYGILSLGPPVIYVAEEKKNSTLSTAEILIQRTGGFTGNVSVTVKTFGGRCVQKEPNVWPFQDVYGVANLTWAVEEEDFEEQALTLTFLDGEREHKISVQILDDEEPEGQEFFYVFLTDPRGGAQIVRGKDSSGFSDVAVIVITGSDLHNGIIGFSEESQRGLELREGAVNGSFIPCIHFQVRKNLTDLPNQFLRQVPHVETHFYVELYDVTAGAAINNSARFARIKVSRPDGPQGLISFAVGSRLAVAQKKATLISLQVARDSGTGMMMSVNFSTQELRSAETIGRVLISPAVSGKDFVRTEGTLVFEPGQRSAMLDVVLTPESASFNVFPKRFQIVLFDPKGGARIDQVYGTANVTLVSDVDSQAIWGLADQLHQPLHEDVLNRVLHNLNLRITTESTDEQLSAVMHLMEKITMKGKSQALSIKSRTLLYELLCELISPRRKDTRGFSHFAEVTEHFAFSLLTDVTCGSPGEKSQTILDSCPYLSILALRWYPQQINGHRFEGKEGDYIQIPERLLDVPDAEMAAGKEACALVQFVEYSSQQWFIAGNILPALKDKVLSLNVKGWSAQALPSNNEVLYRIYAAEPRIVPQTSLCLLWNPAAASWLSDSQFCKVIEDTLDYVECACSHMSVYAVYAKTDRLSSYNEAFFSSGFICVSGQWQGFQVMNFKYM